MIVCDDSFSDDIGASLSSHPDLVSLASLNIDPIANAKGSLHWIGIVRIGNRQCAVGDQMRRQAAVRVRWIVGISATAISMAVLPVSPRIRGLRPVSPGEDVIETPGTDARFKHFAAFGWHVVLMLGMKISRSQTSVMKCLGGRCYVVKLCR